MLAQDEANHERHSKRLKVTDQRSVTLDTETATAGATLTMRDSSSGSRPDGDGEECSEGSTAVTVEDISLGNLSSQASTASSVVRNQANIEPRTQNSQFCHEITMENLLAEDLTHPPSISQGWSTSRFGE
jgi:hypothetical protein